ncbi:MAG: hypothetical protein SVK08_00315 [Halobacteriota archaeon]|nr:hypothetical protein [Halobacteriota archaeon]
MAYKFYETDTTTLFDVLKIEVAKTVEAPFSAAISVIVDDGGERRIAFEDGILMKTLDSEATLSAYKSINSV